MNLLGLAKRWCNLLPKKGQKIGGEKGGEDARLSDLDFISIILTSAAYTSLIEVDKLFLL